MNKNIIPWWCVNLQEQEAKSVYNAVLNKNLSMGIITKEFEEQISKKLNIPYVIATINGSTAILMALIAIGIKKGDEIIIPNRTWIAAVHAVLLLGGKPIIIDVLEEVPIMDTSKIKEAISSKTKAIMPAQLSGRAVYMEEVWKIAKENNLIVIEDSAQGLFSKYNGEYMGTKSDFGCFSMSVAKLLPTGQGGFIVTSNKSYYQKLLKIRTHGINNFTQFVPFETFGFNFRFNDILSSIGLIRLTKINETIKNIKNIYKIYENELKKMNFINIINVNVEKGEIPLYVEVLSSRRDKIIELLSDHDIQTRTLYPDLDKANYFKTHNKFPNSRKFGKFGFVLPCGPDQPIENVYKTIEVLKKLKD